MTDKLKIRLSIADRVYPLTIHPSQEEGLRKAAKDIEVMMKQFEQSYAVKDKQDVLAMCVLQFASKVNQETINEASLSQEMTGRLQKITALLDKSLA